jgi:predicted N-acyltransferase
MTEQRQRTIAVETSIAAIDAAAWDRLANPDPARCNPFLSHAFLRALEESGSIAPDTGWLPQHIALRGPDNALIGAMPCYLKDHSLGEFVFDHGWADAYERYGLDYYPKLLSAVPVTPVPGRRLLVGDPEGPNALERERLLAQAAIALTRQRKASSLHVTFLTESEWRHMGDAGLLQRTSIQYHWQNEGYRSFDDFLATLASRKRKCLKRERRDALADGITVQWLTGRDITEAHWDAFFAFYMDTGSRKWGSPYLNRRFFSLLGAAMAESVLLVMAMRGGRAIAGALNIIGGDCLYGRYWGTTEHQPFLHFELCYYQAIDYAIAHGLRRVEAGAGGEHKLLRGYMPTTTYSVHWIADPRFRSAIADFLTRERSAIERQQALLAEHGPFKRAE